MMMTAQRWSALLLCPLGLAAACSEPDAPGVLERYTAEFRAHNPHSEHSVVRDGYRLAARRFAASGRPSGPPVVLLHGYPDSQHLYDAVIPLVRLEREVVTFDFLGWGASDKPDPAEHVYDAASLRADLEAVISSFGYESLTLVVHDASGWPGIDWALENPDRVASLVILNTVYHPSPSARPPEGLAQYAASGAERDALAELALADDSLWLNGSEATGTVGFLGQIGAFFSSAAARDVYLPILAEESLAMRPAFFALASRLFAEIAGRFQAIPRMAAFARPVTVAFGVDDPYLDLELAADFAARFPTSRRVDIAGGNHYVQLDQPAAVASAILQADRPQPSSTESSGSSGSSASTRRD